MTGPEGHYFPELALGFRVHDVSGLNGAVQHASLRPLLWGSGRKRLLEEGFLG